MKLIKTVSAITALVIFSGASASAAGDYAMLSEAVSKLIEKSYEQDKSMGEFKDRLSTLDDFNKKREQDKILLERMDGDVTKLLTMQAQMERLSNENKMQGEDINGLIRELHAAQLKIQELESMAGDSESRRLADKAARIDKQSFELNSIVAKRNFEMTGNANTAPAQNAPSVQVVSQPQNSDAKDPLQIDILK